MRNRGALAVALALTATACGDLGGGGGSRGPEQNGGAGTSELTGSWQGDCLASASKSGRWSTDSFKFADDGGFERRAVIFLDAKCESHELTQLLKGRYRTPAALTEGSNDISFYVDDVVVTPDTEAAAASMRETQFCGRTDWQQGVAQSVVGAPCSEGVSASASPVLDIYDVREGKLYFGRAAAFVAGSTAKPTSLDLTRGLKKG